MNPLKKLFFLLNSIKEKIHFRNEISKLLNHEDSSIQLIGKTLQKTLNNHFSSEEKNKINTIENLRKELLQSKEVVSVVDYGAGTPRDREEAVSKEKTTDLLVGEICKIASTPPFYASFHFQLIRHLKPTLCLELGTNLGISASYQLAALNLNKSGKLITLEGAVPLAAIAQRNFKKLNLHDYEIVTGRFQDTLETVLVNNKVFDYVLIDGHHNEKATIAYFQKILPFMSENSIIIFDDINWSSEMFNAWREIKSNVTVFCSISLKQYGICILKAAKGTRSKVAYNLYKEEIAGT